METNRSRISTLKTRVSCREKEVPLNCSSWCCCETNVSPAGQSKICRCDACGLV